MTIPDYIHKHCDKNSVTVMTENQFKASGVTPDVILSINVMDVVPPETRLEMLAVVKKRLRSTGQFALLVPRNDSRTLSLCGSTRKYRDGYLFPNHGAFTFYKNWPYDKLLRFCETHGFSILRNLSRYRYCCFVCQPGTNLAGPARSDA